MRALLSLLCIVMGVYSLQSQQQTDSITKELKRIQESSNLVGFAVAIVNKDSTVYSKGCLLYTSDAADE